MCDFLPVSKRRALGLQVWRPNCSMLCLHDTLTLSHCFLCRICAAPVHAGPCPALPCFLALKPLSSAPCQCHSCSASCVRAPMPPPQPARPMRHGGHANGPYDPFPCMSLTPFPVDTRLVSPLPVTCVVRRSSKPGRISPVIDRVHRNAPCTQLQCLT